MIRKISDQWDGVEQRTASGMTKQAGTDESNDGAGILEQIVGVRRVLKRMADVNVTRHNFKDAVREALLPILKEHRDEIFPELIDGQLNLGIADVQESSGLPEEFVSRLEGFETRIQRLASLEGRVEDLDQSVAERFAEQESRGDSKLRESETRQAEKLAELERRLGEQLQEGQAQLQEAQELLQAGQVSLGEKVEQLTSDLGRVEESIPEQARAAASDVEGRLRQEMEAMVEQLASKLGEVQEILQRFESASPRKEDLAVIDTRMAGLEETLRHVSSHVDSINAVGLGEQFSSLKQQVRDASEALESGTADSRAALGLRLDELQKILLDGIHRWESDQSTVHSRLTSLRDSLRDQVMDLGQQMAKEKASLWGKISKKDPGLKLSSDDFDDLSGKLEGIISGLEGILSKKND